MTYEDIDDAISQYHDLTKAVFHAAKTHLTTRWSMSHRFAKLNEFYCENGKIIVVLGFYSPYSGTTTIELLPEEVAFSEPPVVLEEPAKPEHDDIELAIIKLSNTKTGLVDRSLSIEETDEIFNKFVDKVPIEHMVYYGRFLSVTHNLKPNEKSTVFSAYLAKLKYLIAP